MLLPIKDCGKGVNKDLPAHELALGMWSDALNIEFDGATWRRRSGIQSAYTTPTAIAYYLQSYVTASARFLVQAGLSSIFVDDGTTRTDITGPVPTGTRSNRWTGGDYNGVLILNNGVDAPMYWNGDVATDLATLTAWPAGYKADTVRPFLDFLIAGAVTKNTGIKYPQLLMWSSPSDPGAVPSTWAAAATNQAGDDPMTGKGAIIDMLPFGAVNVIYCQQGRVAMRYVGGEAVFAFDPMPGADGLMATGCVVETPKGHVFLSNGDVLIHNGGEATSIAEDRIRNWLFSTIDPTNGLNAFLVANPQRAEVWVCFPKVGSTECDRAAVWNWVSDTWAIYSLPNVTYAASGVVPPLSVGTWANDSETWDSDASTWDQNEYGNNEAKLILATSTPTLGVANSGSTDFGSSVSQLLERKGIKPDETDAMMVLSKSRWPVAGIAANTLTIFHGTHKLADTDPEYATSATHTQGTTDWVTRRTNRGRYLAIKMTSTTSQPLSGRSVSLEYEVVGRYG